MAKGNMLLGYARGKVGSLVFTRRKGEQITRPRNFSPANPRTLAQLSQRVRMYAPVKLYRQSMERFFKYAFSLKSQETIFNGFMRENISISPWTPRELAVAQAPVPFPARMSSGGLGGFLPRPSGGHADDYTAVKVGNYSVGQSPLNENDAYLCVCLSREEVQLATIGELSTYIIQNFPDYVDGDMLTFVGVATDSLALEDGIVSYDGTGGFNFNYTRLILDVNSDAAPSTVGLTVDARVGGTYIYYRIPAHFEDDSYGGCVIHTRNVGTTVDANNTYLVLGGLAGQIYETMTTEYYRRRAATSYKAAPDAYLNPATASN